MNFDPADISYVPTTGVRRVHETPLVAASDDTLHVVAARPIPDGI